jgi:hypothetical protein
MGPKIGEVCLKFNSFERCRQNTKDGKRVLRHGRSLNLILGLYSQGYGLGFMLTCAKNAMRYKIHDFDTTLDPP